jgi:hypothetical protein
MRRPEEALHRQIVELLNVYEARGLLAFCHPYNGGYRTPAEAGIGTALGVKAGVPDLLIWLPYGKHVCVELKAPLAKARLSPAQIGWIRRMTDMGVAVHVCRSIDEVEAVLRDNGVPAVGQLSPGIAATAPQSVAGALEGQKATRANPHPLSSHSRSS